MSEHKDKAVEAYDLLQSDLVGLLQKHVDTVAKTLADVRQQLETAKKHGLGEHLMAQSLIVNVYSDLNKFKQKIDTCLDQIAGTQGD